jgi:hypothetical protein
MDPANKEWRNLGPIRAKQDLRDVQTEPGLYKLTFRVWDMTYTYIGQAGNLQRRISDYLSPTQGNKMEHFLHDLIEEAGEAELSICCVGLEPEKVRCHFENTAIAEARKQGLECLNRGRPDDVRMRRFRLESEARMLNKDLEHVRAELAKLKSGPVKGATTEF